MTKVLQLAPKLALPLEAATRRMAILAMSGAGKSNLGVVMAEHGAGERSLLPRRSALTVALLPSALEGAR